MFIWKPCNDIGFYWKLKSLKNGFSLIGPNSFVFEVVRMKWLSLKRCSLCNSLNSVMRPKFEISLIYALQVNRYYNWYYLQKSIYLSAAWWNFSKELTGAYPVSYLSKIKQKETKIIWFVANTFKRYNDEQ